ncbi:MAG: O-antigen ligase family protein [Verrucomicrobiota bacterium]
MAAAAACSLAIASVPVFSYQESYSFIPQFLAAVAIGFGVLTCSLRLPRLHLAMVAYVGLVLIFGVSVLQCPEAWDSYQTTLKVGLLALVSHIVFRTPKQLLWLFVIYSSAGVVTLTLNWHELEGLRTSSAASGIGDSGERFAGTMQNANTAGMYGVMVTLGALIVFSRARNALRWVLLLTGVISGLALGYYSGSRKAMLGMCVLSIAVPWIALSARRSDDIAMIRRVLLLALLIPIAALILVSLPNNERFFALFTEREAADSSSLVRYDMIRTSLELWLQRPLLGHGYDSFARLSGFGAYSHTTFGEILANAGFVGMALISAFYILPAWDLVRLVTESIACEPPGLAPGLAGFLGALHPVLLFRSAVRRPRLHSDVRRHLRVFDGQPQNATVGGQPDILAG